MKPLWKGTVSFGLVNVGVRLFTAVQEKNIHFHMMTKDGKCRLRQKLYCPETGKEYDFSETAKGYEVAPDQYVIVDREELNSLQPESEGSFDIDHFVDLTEIDPLFFRGSYYLVAEEGAEKSFALLRETLEKSGKIAVGTFVMREKEYLACIRPYENVLALETMYFEQDIRAIDDLPIPEKDPKVKPAELELALKLVDAGTVEFDHKKYKNDYQAKVKNLIERKAKGKPILLAHGESKKRTDNVVDLTEALKQSLRKRASGKKAPAKKSSKRTKKAAAS